ncbi:acyl-CoA thioesterase [Sporomusaceae bacterium BoRhaA]|uniref:PaaI family thioesterase n=1 Tax=Pelorhabdus rhamnosifermentans TaxID=2772457 RepID=UPI001FE9CF23|nr:PaaI family thioesterase [Pelorhabdus rhamnosifermentans]MBU2704039.1 acyl-CoA thioesterase [Pelorhabdus rhamnosifermentans]
MDVYVAQFKNCLQAVYKKNPFINLLEMKITALEAGRITMTMPVVFGKHTNVHQIAHGGALASLADTAMGLACGTLDQKVVTMDMNINFVRGAKPDQLVYAHAEVIHQGKKTLVVEAAVVDSEEKLLAKSRGTFFVVGRFSEGSDFDECKQGQGD